MLGEFRKEPCEKRMQVDLLADPQTRKLHDLNARKFTNLRSHTLPTTFPGGGRIVRRPSGQTSQLANTLKHHKAARCDSLRTKDAISTIDCSPSTAGLDESRNVESYLIQHHTNSEGSKNSTTASTLSPELPTAAILVHLLERRDQLTSLLKQFNNELLGLLHEEWSITGTVPQGYEDLSILLDGGRTKLLKNTSYPLSHTLVHRSNTIGRDHNLMEERKCATLVPATRKHRTPMYHTSDSREPSCFKAHQEILDSLGWSASSEGLFSDKSISSSSQYDSTSIINENTSHKLSFKEEFHNLLNKRFQLGNQSSTETTHSSFSLNAPKYGKLNNFNESDIMDQNSDCSGLHSQPDNDHTTSLDFSQEIGGEEEERAIEKATQEVELRRLEVDFEVLSQLYKIHKQKAKETKLESYRIAYKSNLKKLKEITEQIERVQYSILNIEDTSSNTKSLQPISSPDQTSTRRKTWNPLKLAISQGTVNMQRNANRERSMSTVSSIEMKSFSTPATPNRKESKLLSRVLTSRTPSEASSVTSDNLLLNDADNLKNRRYRQRHVSLVPFLHSRLFRGISKDKDNEAKVTDQTNDNLPRRRIISVEEFEKLPRIQTLVNNEPVKLDPIPSSPQLCSQDQLFNDFHYKQEVEKNALSPDQNQTKRNNRCNEPLGDCNCTPNLPNSGHQPVDLTNANSKVQQNQRHRSKAYSSKSSTITPRSKCQKHRYSFQEGNTSTNTFGYLRTAITRNFYSLPNIQSPEWHLTKDNSDELRFTRPHLRHRLVPGQVFSTNSESDKQLQSTAKSSGICLRNSPSSSVCEAADGSHILGSIRLKHVPKKATSSNTSSNWSSSGCSCMSSQTSNSSPDANRLNKESGMVDCSATLSHDLPEPLPEVPGKETQRIYRSPSRDPVLRSPEERGRRFLLRNPIDKETQDQPFGALLSAKCICSCISESGSISASAQCFCNSHIMNQPSHLNQTGYQTDLDDMTVDNLSTSVCGQDSRSLSTLNHFADSIGTEPDNRTLIASEHSFIMSSNDPCLMTSISENTLDYELHKGKTSSGKPGRSSLKPIRFLKHAVSKVKAGSKRSSLTRTPVHDPLTSTIKQAKSPVILPALTTKRCIESLKGDTSLSVDTDSMLKPIMIAMPAFQSNTPSSQIPNVLQMNKKRFTWTRRFRYSAVKQRDNL